MRRRSFARQNENDAVGLCARQGVLVKYSGRDASKGRTRIERNYLRYDPVA